MIHYYVVDDNHGNFYKLGIKGMREEVEKFLQSFSRNVRYQQSKEVDKQAKGKRKIGDMEVIYCKFVGILKTKKGEEIPNGRQALQLDSRHTQWAN